MRSHPVRSRLSDRPRRDGAPRRRGGPLAAAIAVAVLVGAAPDGRAAEPWPTRPVHVVVTSSAGSTGDTTLRILAAPLEKALGQPVVVENAPGSGGLIGTEKVVRAAPDGATLGLISNNHAINPSIYRQVPFDSLRDIAPVALIGKTPVVLFVRPTLPVRTVQDLVALAKSKPGELTYGSAGNGTVLHLAAVLFTSEAGVEMRHVPYKTLAQMTADVASGQIDVGFAGVASVAGLVKGNRLRALAVSTAGRSPVLPEVPTMAEGGLPAYDFEPWLAVVGPAGLPAPIVERLSAELNRALARPDVRAALAAQGVTPVESTPARTAGFLRDEMAKHARLVERSGAKME